MVKISVEIHSGTVRFAVGVQTPTIQQAVDIAATRSSGNIVRVKSPIGQVSSAAEDRAT